MWSAAAMPPLSLSLIELHTTVVLSFERDGHQHRRAGDWRHRAHSRYSSPVKGRPDVATLVGELASESSDARKAAAAALGKVPQSEESFAALTRALGDSAPKVRKSAAIALARPGNAAAVAPLAAALEREEFDWVRASLVLAIGKIGGAAAQEAFAAPHPRGEAEAEALAKATDRLRERSDDVAWRRDATLPFPLYGTTAVGIEDVAAGEAAGLGIDADVAGAGLIALRGRAPAGLLATLRCFHDLRLLVAEGEPLSGAPADSVPAALVQLLRRATGLASWNEWLESNDDVLRYRFSLENLRLPQSAFRAALGAVRDALRPAGPADSASSYSAILVIDAGAERTRVWFVPTFEPDTRFAYRLADVGASIQPVVGAALARLIRSHEDGIVVDPTCGSATLLIERARLDPGLSLHGIDVSPTATAAASRNLAAAGLRQRARLERGDAADGRSWPDHCVEVIANLPFGVRSARMDRDLASLYRGVVRQAAHRLVPGGRALFYTSNAPLLAPELEQRPNWTILHPRTIESGGIAVGAWLIEKR